MFGYNSGMTKTEAIKLLGGTPRTAAEAIGCTRSAIYMWPEVLEQKHIDRVNGAVTRIKAGIKKGKK